MTQPALATLLHWRRQMLGAGLCVCAWPGVMAADRQGKLWPLPPPSEAIVLRWEYAGGTMAPGSSAEPVLWIQADGRYSAPPSVLGGARRVGQLTREALGTLLTEIVVAQRFASLHREKIEAQIRAQAQATGQIVLMADAGITRLEVHLPALHHTLELANAHAVCQQFPQIPELRRVGIILQRLLALVEATPIPPR